MKLEALQDGASCDLSIIKWMLSLRGVPYVIYCRNVEMIDILQRSTCCFGYSAQPCALGCIQCTGVIFAVYSSRKRNSCCSKPHRVHVVCGAAPRVSHKRFASAPQPPVIPTDSTLYRGHNPSPKTSRNMSVLLCGNKTQRPKHHQLVSSNHVIISWFLVLFAYYLPSSYRALSFCTYARIWTVREG